MELTRGQFATMMPNGERAGRLDKHWPFINPAITEFQMGTPARIAAVFAQIAQESGEYRYMEEIADGSAYEGRKDLGNIQPGDGRLYKGHGPIQITGRANHLACGTALGLDLIKNPRLIMEPEHATRSAFWFWNSRNLSALADEGTGEAFREITRRINGGYTHHAERTRYWMNNKAVLGIADSPAGEPGRPFLQKGSEGEAVAYLQAVLGLEADGVFGEKTRAAVMLFQETHMLDADGKVGPKTWAAIEEADAGRHGR